MGTGDFQERLGRIGADADIPPGKGARVHNKNNGSGIGKFLWSAFGVIWGFAANSMVMFANANYDKAKADVDTPEMIQLVAATGAFGILSWFLIAILLVLSFFFLRKKKGLRMLVIGFFLGVAVASLALFMAGNSV